MMLLNVRSASWSIHASSSPGKCNESCLRAGREVGKRERLIYIPVLHHLLLEREVSDI